MPSINNLKTTIKFRSHFGESPIYIYIYVRAWALAKKYSDADSGTVEV